LATGGTVGAAAAAGAVVGAAAGFGAAVGALVGAAAAGAVVGAAGGAVVGFGAAGAAVGLAGAACEQAASKPAPEASPRNCKKRRREVSCISTDTPLAAHVTRQVLRG